jgi:hypothetical protein
MADLLPAPIPACIELVRGVGATGILLRGVPDAPASALALAATTVADRLDVLSRA